MSRYTDWRKRRKLERELAELWEHFAPQMKAAQSEDEDRYVYEMFSIDAADTVRDLERIKT